MSNISNSNLLTVKGLPLTSESISNEIQQRLSLYQVFVKLYENHTHVLEQILKLENLSESSSLGTRLHYIHGVIDSETVYVTTNLADGNSQTLRQSQNTWTIGRDRKSGIYINNKYVSRRHAAIRYIEQGSHFCKSVSSINTGAGFYLIDFNSTNGTYINGEQIYQPSLLEDGDIIQIGNITFSFFINDSCRILPTVAVELLMQLGKNASDDNDDKKGNERTVKRTYYQNKTKTQKLEDSGCIQEESLFSEVAKMETFEEQLSQQWKSDILDRFYSKQASLDSL